MDLKNNMVLRSESPAPPIKVDDWLRCEPLTSFEPGKVYLVEFWATWCGPCVAAMPHLMQLQEKYQDSGFEVVGVAASEEGPTAEGGTGHLGCLADREVPESELSDRVRLRRRNERTMDESQFFSRHSHLVRGRPRWPHRFLLNGSWRGSDEAKAADLERIASNQRTTRELSLSEPIYANLRPAMQAEDWTGHSRSSKKAST